MKDRKNKKTEKKHVAEMEKKARKNSAQPSLLIGY